MVSVFGVADTKTISELGACRAQKRCQALPPDPQGATDRQKALQKHAAIYTNSHFSKALHQRLVHLTVHVETGCGDIRHTFFTKNVQSALKVICCKKRAILCCAGATALRPTASPSKLPRCGQASSGCAHAANWSHRSTCSCRQCPGLGSIVAFPRSRFQL